MDLRIIAGGDAEHGWLVDLHDGVTAAVYRPEAPNAFDAAKAAIDAHVAAIAAIATPAAEPPVTEPTQDAAPEA